MRILYGLAGEGMGHATRSAVVIRHLLSRGHDVLVATSGRPVAFMRRNFPRVLEIGGLRLLYRDGAVDLRGALLDSAARLPAMLARAGAAFREVDAFGPQMVFTDFDSFAHAYGRANGRPLVSIDNFHVIPRCAHHPAVLGGRARDFAAARRFVAMKITGCHHYIVTSFFFPPLRPEYAASTTLVPPVVRPEIARAKPIDAGHVLVYQTAPGDTRLLQTLATMHEQRFLVYGFGREGTFGNAVCKPFSEGGFVADLASSRAVIANGGMSLLGESIYLGKPVYSVPLRGHFEQCMNADYVSAMGYGATSDAFDANTLRRFMADVPRFAETIRATTQPDGNARLLQVVDSLVQQAADGTMVRQRSHP